MTPPRPHIIAANPSGDQLTTARSTALDDRAKSSTPSNVDLDRLYASYADDRPNLYRDIIDEEEGADELVAEWRASIVDAIVMVLVAMLIGVLLATGGGM